HFAGDRSEASSLIECSPTRHESITLGDRCAKREAQQGWPQNWGVALDPQIETRRLASRLHKRGASRSSRTLEAGCDGRADGEVVWSWHPVAGAKPFDLREATVTQSRSHRGDHEIIRETIAQGMFRGKNVNKINGESGVYPLCRDPR